MPAGIPNVLQFVKAFREDLLLRRGPEDALVQYLDALKEAWKAASQEDPSFPPEIGLERLYELLNHLTGQEEARFTIPLRLKSRFPEPSRAGELLAWDLKKYIQKRCLGFDRKKLTYLGPLFDFVDPRTGLDILTLNYDTTIETTLRAAQIPWSDGFPEDESTVTSFSTDQFLKKPCQGAVRLLKLHGSASWYQNASGICRILTASQRSAGLRFGAARTMTHEAMMIYPTLQKALTDGPFPALMLAAQEILKTSKLLLAIGYGFADRHIRQMVLRALANNRELQLVLVNPWPESSLKLLFKELRRTEDLRGRIGVCGVQRNAKGALQFGFVDQALKDSWLLKQSNQWIHGTALEDPIPEAQRAVRREGRPWEIRYQLPGGAVHLALAQLQSSLVLWILTGKPRQLLKLDLGSGVAEPVAAELAVPRGMAWDPKVHQLYLVENQYRTRTKLPDLPLVSGKTGLGRIWAFDTEGRVIRALTGMKSAVVLPRLTKLRHSDRGLSEVLGRGTGFLVWPTSLLLERPGESLLVTEARDLARLDLLTGDLSYPVEIPLCFNLCGLAKGPGETVLLVDGGVHPTGRGRLMIAHLPTRSVKTLAQGETRFNSVLWHERSQLALVSVGWSWPRGQVIAFQISADKAQLIGSWKGLDRPGSLVAEEGAETALVATTQGVVELNLGTVGF